MGIVGGLGVRVSFNFINFTNEVKKVKIQEKYMGDVDADRRI